MDNSGIGQLVELKKSLIDSLNSDNTEASFSVARELRLLQRQLKVRSSDPAFDTVVNNLANGSTEALASAKSYFGIRQLPQNQGLVGNLAKRYLPKFMGGGKNNSNPHPDPLPRGEGYVEGQSFQQGEETKGAPSPTIVGEGGGEGSDPGDARDNQNKPKEKLAQKLARQYQETASKVRNAMRAGQLAMKLLPVLLNPITWAVLGGIVLLAITLTIGIYFFKAGEAGIGGTTPRQTANPILDNDIIAKVLLMNGDEDIKTVMATDFFNRLQRALTDYKAATASTEKQTKIDGILEQIGLYLNTPSLEQGKKIITLCQETLRYQEIPVLAGTRTRKPLDSVVGYNNTDHGGEIINGRSASFHSLYAVGNSRDIHGNSICDAVDLHSSEVDTPVYPLFDGTVVRTFTDHPGPNGETQKVVIIENDRHRIYLAHLRDVNKHAGDSVSVDEVLGKTGKIGSSKPQVHIELLYKQNDGKYRCAITTDVDRIEAKQNNKPKGYYLWRTMAGILNINIGS